MPQIQKFKQLPARATFRFLRSSCITAERCGKVSARRYMVLSSGTIRDIHNVNIPVEQEEI